MDFTLAEILDKMGIIPIVFALFFGVQLIISETGKIQSNRILARYFFSITAVLTAKYLIDIGIHSSLAAALFFPLMFLLAPMVFQYSHYLTKQNIQHEKFEFWKHFSFPIIAIAISLVAYFSYTVFGEEHAITNLFMQVFYLLFENFSWLFILQNGIYLVLLFLLIDSYKKEIDNYSSFKEGLDLKWISSFLISYLASAISYILLQLIEIEGSVFYLVILIHILYAGFYVINQNLKLYKLSLEAEFQKKQNETTRKTNSFVESDEPKLQESKKEGLKERILEEFQENEVFLDQELTIYKLSQKLEVNSKYISQIINQEFEVNFVSFVNKYRIEKAKELLVDEQFSKLTIEGIGMEAGFKSKSSFNNAFKKLEGSTPSNYRSNVVDK